MANPADVISYIGIPLAVLGVAPILYTCIRSVVTVQSIRKALKKNSVEAVTRGSLMSGIVEVEIPKCSIVWQTLKESGGLRRRESR
jgi:mannose/fructose/N-acetylgalactosamine-specific phosphotransferase system component IIC